MVYAPIDNARAQSPTYPPHPVAPPPLPPSGANLNDQQVRDEAQRILDTGSKTFATDDYDARLDEFARVAGTLDDSSAARLFQELRSQDGGAFHSWLQGDRLLSLNESGRVTDQELGQVVDGFATAYNNGAFSGDATPLGALSFLNQDAFTLVSPMGALPGNETLNSIDRLLGAGDSALIDPVREGIGRDLIDEYTFGDQANQSNGEHAAYAIHLMGDASEATQAARVFGGYNAEQRETLLNDVATGSSTFGVDPNSPDAPTDPLSKLITEIGAKGFANPPLPSASGERWGDIATDVVRWAEGAKDALGQDAFTNYDNQPRADRADALSRLFNGHSKAILDNLTDTRNLQYDASTGDPDDTLIGRDGVALGNLFRLTAFNGDSYQSSVASDQLGDYVGRQREAIASGNEAERGEAINRLSYIAAAGGDAVQQLHGDIQADAEARKAFVEFVADIALGAVPFGDALNGAATKAISDAFGEGLINTVANNISGPLIEAGTGQLTDAAKAAITDQLGSDTAAIADGTAAANFVRNAIFAGADTTGSADDLTSGITAASVEIERARTE